MLSCAAKEISCHIVGHYFLLLSRSPASERTRASEKERHRKGEEKEREMQFLLYTPLNFRQLKGSRIAVRWLFHSNLFLQYVENNDHRKRQAKYQFKQHEAINLAALCAAAS
jgi:hypothetical protein